MKMFELIPYILELDPEAEVMLIEDLEPRSGSNVNRRLRTR